MMGMDYSNVSQNIYFDNGLMQQNAAQGLLLILVYFWVMGQV